MWAVAPSCLKIIGRVLKNWSQNKHPELSVLECEERKIILRKSNK
jgi:hypothetical protein